MVFFISSFLVAFLATLLIVRSASSHAHLSGDTDKDQPQKFHARVVPRIGGVGIVVGVLAGAMLMMQKQAEGWLFMTGLVACGLIAFSAGLIEDFTKRVTPRQRLLATVVAAAMAAWLLDAVIPKTGIPGLDDLLLIAGVPVALTLLAVAGVANSVNIIDGFNGLASMCVAIMLAAVAYVAFQVGDTTIMNCALITLGAVLGFFVWNYPLGLIFLGDGGAYFLGFWVAELGILLVCRNEAVSPIFPLLLCAYPIFETLFTMYRRRVIRGRPVGLPDATHLHSLIYRRLMRWAVGKRDASNMLRRNSMTSPYLWVLCSLSVCPAVLWWDDGSTLSIMLLVFCASYVALYRAIVRFRTPRVLLRKAEHWAAPVVEH
ncbi:UDP-N-acetylmuramyl pentapeptide phosphotransferase/UDP-N-acetylglucosamine-1-phosphate transferase [Sphaerotilus hippei]|uniref:UDP-N-acetylmuramyl pentapeptide phosphotransferase/UDP-N-acetylglucosamine-1-phosphate transferase n=1 Tax=Sphaerotilus hippei TaxID=744406 RepID=A0A318H6K2_9BURK|nr:glycosyltransferase [Sphaerotilus hippei]PXW97070.1 UDP-N-acetylmuramyl pentapeptide phosphotransferase/UDP-N-acetylglucosamine-1-phosphate transferase [Sphaerotilus hippei]